MTESQPDSLTAVNTNKEDEEVPGAIMVDDCLDTECLASGSSSFQEEENDSPEEIIEGAGAEAVSSSPLSSSTVSLARTEEQKEGSAVVSVQEPSPLSSSSPSATESTTEPATAPTDNTNSNEEEKTSDTESAAAKWNKARVAVTGGLVTAVGLVMIPAPLPVGAIITAYGVSILAQEFDGAQVALENSKKALEEGFEKLADSLHKDDGEESVTEVKDGDCKTVEEAATKAMEDQPQEEKEQELPTEAISCSSPVTEEKEVTELTAEEVTTKETTSAELAPLTNDQELEDILLNEEQSFREGAGKVWDLHTRNMRKVTSRFITTKLLPALRDVNIGASPADETKSVISIGVTNNTSAFPSASAYVESSKVLDDVISVNDTASSMVPMSTTSIASSSESSSSDESSNESDNVFVEVDFPTQVAATSS